MIRMKISRREIMQHITLQQQFRFLGGLASDKKGGNGRSKGVDWSVLVLGTKGIVGFVSLSITMEVGWILWSSCIISDGIAEKVIWLFVDVTLNLFRISIFRNTFYSRWYWRWNFLEIETNMKDLKNSCDIFESIFVSYLNKLESKASYM